MWNQLILFGKLIQFAFNHYAILHIQTNLLLNEYGMMLQNHYQTFFFRLVIDLKLICCF